MGQTNLLLDTFPFIEQWEYPSVPLASIKKSDKPSAHKSHLSCDKRSLSQANNSRKYMLAKNVVKLRHSHGFTQEKLAELAGIDRRYVQRIERGTANPGVDILSELRDALACTWSDLLGP